MSKPSRTTKEEIDLVPHEPPSDPPAQLEPVDRITQYPHAVQQATPRSLAQEEQSALRRISPRRNRWPELAAIDERVAELEQRAAGVREELQRLTQERSLAPEHDARALADWIAKGERGRKPEPTAPELDRRIEELERERDALVRATDDRLEEKATFVEKHRRKLVRDADSNTGEICEQIEGLITQLASKREELVETRHAAIWAATFPSGAATVSPPRTVAGGVRRSLEKANIGAQVEAERIYELLREDARYLSQALTEEQAREMGLKRPDAAVWSGTAEGNEAERKEKKAALKRYKEMWGHEPV